MPKKPKKLGKDKTLEQWLIPHLRGISKMWPMKGVAQARARVKVESGEYYKNGNPIIVTKYKCAMCGDLFDKEEIDVDHIVPIANLEGFTNWEEYITRLFCPPDNLQILCKSDHYIKSKAETEERKVLNKLKKQELLKKIKKDENLY